MGARGPLEPTAFGGGRRFAPLWGAFGAHHRFIIFACINLLCFVKTILHVAFDLNATHSIYLYIHIIACIINNDINDNDITYIYILYM